MLYTNVYRSGKELDFVNCFAREVNNKRICSVLPVPLW